MAQCGWCWNFASTTTSTTPCIYCGRIFPWGMRTFRHTIEVDSSGVPEDPGAGGGGSGLTSVSGTDGGEVLAPTALVLPGTVSGSDGDIATVVSVSQRTTSLTNAQIRALPTATGIVLVPAPGAGKFILPLAAVMVANFTSLYTNVDGTAFLYLLSGTTGVLSGQCLIGDGNWFDNRTGQTVATIGRPFFSDLGITGETSEGLLSQFENEPLRLTASNGSGDFTAGHAANTLTVTVLYTIVTL